MINRRGFLGLLATGTALAFIPIQLKLGLKHRFDSTQDYGNCLTLRPNERYDNLPPRVLNTLHKDAKYILPPGTLYEIRATIPTNFGRHKRVAWYYNCYMTIQSNPRSRIVEEYGYIFISQHRA